MIDKPWDDEYEIALLKDFWARGVAMTAIALRLGRSKNSIMGKVHRLGLTPRQSPIRKGAAPRQIARAGLTTLPPLASVSEIAD